MTVEEHNHVLFDQAAAAASDLAAFAVSMKEENYEAAASWLEAAKDKIAEIDNSLDELVHLHRRGKI